MLNPLTKLWRDAILGFVGLVIIVAAVVGVQHWREQRARVAVTTVVNDSTKARTALESTGRKDLPSLIDASKTMDGTLVAGVRIVTRPETIYVKVRPAPTTILPDSSRTASLTDTTKGYIINVQADAPKFPAPLKLGYTIVTPSFHPEVGFVKKGDGYYAVVTWAGQQFDLEKAFFVPPKERPLALITGADVIGAPTGGISTTTLSVRGYVGVQYTTPKRFSVELLGGMQNTSPFIGLGVRKRLW